MVEAGAVKRHHWSGILMKNLLDSISGAFAFWIIGFSVAFSKPDSRGLIGIGNSQWVASAGWDDYFTEELYLKFIFQFAFVNTSSAIVGGLKIWSLLLPCVYVHLSCSCMLGLEP